MRLYEWIDQRPNGELSRLSRVTAVSYTTVLAAVATSRGKPNSKGRIVATEYGTAKKLSDATKFTKLADGTWVECDEPAVTVEEICEPAREEDAPATAEAS